MKKSTPPQKEDLQGAYTAAGSTLSSLGKVYGVSHPTVRNWLLQYEIPLKTHHEASREANRRGDRPIKISPEAQARLQDRDWLYDQRIIQKRALETIAGDLGFSGLPPLYDALKKFGLDDTIDGRRRNSTANRCLEDYQWMYDNYVVQKRTMEDIATILGTSKATVQRFVAFHDITPTPPNSYPRKFNRLSKPCRKIIAHIQTYYSGKVEENNRSVCGGRELDIYFPEKNFAIEYNGVYHHLFKPSGPSYALQKDKSYHLSKTETCEKQGIQLIHIFSDEYARHPEIINSLIRHRLGYTLETLHARKCEVREISPTTKNEFLNNNHLQGEDRSRFKYGLFHENRLVSVMTFAKPRFASYSWELTRFCNLNNTNIIGGFSKLLKHFQRNNLGSIVSYADRRYSQGAVYEKNGFKRTRTNPPGYYYVKRGTEVRLHRMHFQKPKGIMESEYDWTQSLGYDRIYDCGTYTYVLM